MTRSKRRVTATRRTAATAAVLAASASLLSAGALPATAADSPVQYVALGDSYASGPGITPKADEACKRSRSNYPAIAASALEHIAGPDVEFKDVSCSGATTRDLWNTQSTASAPQLDALTGETDLVSVTIGGNDLGFTRVLQQCVIAGLGDRAGSPCRDQLTSGGTDRLETGIATLRDRIGSMLTDIDRRSPGARVALVGYPALFPAEGDSCDPSTVPLAKGDVAYLDATTRKLNTMLAEEAREAGAVYVDAYKVSEGHDMCRPQDKRWYEPLMPVNDLSAHPNVLGHFFVALHTAEALRQP
ncbi:SGNH/GDSL hydrolase family protein [Streptomyces sp. TRM 70361]|uniref:SGNH/GDSL hydrolase family protein n=1 Tax=Streptomyces sp. TRM 70361 TaxID=3116553 RepID=UPI002E7BE86B|nr:SGNH/GDSL hydrolase family protein [Streptomyces sp. TRM 70361]MEE1938973.1 SGNH/GDSL hydrolase family protein [Streptomyces sp. TRM 70361]